MVRIHNGDKRDGVKPWKRRQRREDDDRADGRDD